MVWGQDYAMCPYMWSAARKKLQISTHNVSLGRFFALEPLASDDLVLLACNVYAVLSVTNTQRAIDRKCSERDLPLRLWEAHRTLSTTHSGLRRRYMNIWTA